MHDAQCVTLCFTCALCLDSHSVVPWLCTVDTWVQWSRVVCLLSFSWQGTLREVESLTAALSQQVRSQP